MIYFVVFAISCFFTFLADKKFKINKKKSGIIFSILAITTPVLLAGLRDVSIGTDVNYYLTYDLYSASNYTNFISYYLASGEEILFSLIVFIVNKICNNINVLMFVLQLFMTTLIYLEIYRNRDKYNMSLAMFIYLIFVYPRFLNLIRQGLAVSIIIYSMRFIEKPNKRNFYFSVFVAFLFHRTAIFSLPLYFLYNSIQKKKNFNILVIYMVVILSALSYDYVLGLLINIGFLPTKFEAFLSEFAREEIAFDIYTALYKLVWIILLIILNKYNRSNENKYKFYIHLLIIDIILWEFNYKILNAERLSYYYGLLAMINFYPQIANVRCRKKEQRLIFICILVLLSILYFWWKFIYFHSGEIYPYKFGG